MSTPKPNAQQAFTGLEQLAALVRAQSWRGIGSPSVPPTQAAVLHFLVGEPQGQRASRLAERIGVSAASLSDSLKALEAKSWIKREPDPTDARAAVIRLTRRGSAMAAKLAGGEGGIGSLMDSLGEADLGAFLRVTQLLVHEAQKQGLLTGPRTCLGCRWFRPYEGHSDQQPHYCAFVQQSFGDPELRTNCAEHEPAEEALALTNATRFRQANPL